ncbi:MAG: NAD+ synthase [Deltaproteobacteria bacterium]|nr:NAD+ synthase [Deltaproteobacteria bacterium]
MPNLRIAMAQINPTVGALAANADKIALYGRKAVAKGADIVLFPELAITGYPPEDLLHKSGFIDDNIACLHRLGPRLAGIIAIVGFVDRGKGGLYNAAAVVVNGRVAAVYHKMFLPNYGVFDEERYFKAGVRALNLRIGGVMAGLEICEDIWRDDGPACVQAAGGAQVIVNINASPYHAGKLGVRRELITRRAVECNAAVAYCNAVGGQDELVFDGQSMIAAPDGEIIAEGRAFAEDLIVADLRLPALRHERPLKGLGVVRLTPVKEVKKLPLRKRRALKPITHDEEILKALRLGVVDYVTKNGFERVCIGLSGGIDSALVAAIAADAIGSANVTGVFMPSRYTSNESRDDARRLAKNLGVGFMTVAIEDIFKVYLETLAAPFKRRGADITEENLQARIRGNILMALSNKFGWLVLTTGNKSEMSVGYATLYGDMAGGFAVIKDLPKTLVYEIAGAVNRLAGKAVIPERVFTKAPTAELRPNQTDQDTLPPYDVLDAILKAYVEDDMSLVDIVALGFDRGVARRVIRMVDGSEYKRRQAPPGIKITPRAFGKDRRMPITNGYKNGGGKKG